MKAIRIILYLVLIPVGAFLLFLLYASIDNYSPEEISSLPVEGEPSVLPDTAELDLLIWNIGYAGLDASMDFFYDGGEKMRPEEEGVRSNLQGILETLSPYKKHDFILLQEVDKDSKRSYHINQTEAITMNFPLHQTCFGKNYDVFFVPIPLSNPMGKVTSGLFSLSGHIAHRADRHSFPGNYSWPMSLFMLDRCFLVQRFHVNNGKELLVVNTHNSAYDDGSLRARQMDFMKGFLLEEYNKGNYVIVGGDWNQSPNGLAPELPYHLYDTINLTYVEEGYPAEEWTWAFDPGLPTNRRVTKPYHRESSLTTIIDCYLLSPNISLCDVQTLDLDFRDSDHQPVLLNVKLQPGEN